MSMQKNLSSYYKIVSTLVILFITGFLMFSCTPEKKKTRSGKLQVVTTTGMISDAVKNIGGNHVEVNALMGPGVDPHLYKATHGDLERITEADIIFFNGLHLEGKMGEVLEKAGRTRVVIPISKNIDVSRLRSNAENNNTYDPHIWFDVRLWKDVVSTISETLQEQDSINAQEYKVNTEMYLRELDSLDLEVRTLISTIPRSGRVLITAHDAFGYFGDAYDIEVRGLQGISTLSEFGLKDVTLLVNFIMDRKIKAIFVESSVSDKSIGAVLEGCQDKGWNVVIGGTLYSDALGDAGTPAGSYTGMVRTNVNTIVKSLK